ncbi:DUF3617 domain-containing protein [Roseateles puraquae]|jgi:hypothetical protein|uniref:DUF3617 domain-containing protein n=1 Tax=Roseateles puraquae TaxID=431059 RepID=UPI0031E14A35
MRSCLFRRRVGGLAPLLLAATAAHAAPVIEVKPGLWASDSEIWINGQSLKAGMQALRAKVRSGLSDAQKAELDKAQAGEHQACLSPAQARIDLARYLEQSLRNSGPWTCEVNASQLDKSEAAGSYVCRTGGGGLSQGRFSASYGPTSYRFELNGRGNAVDGRTGQALGAIEMDQRMLSTGRWVGGDC